LLKQKGNRRRAATMCPRRDGRCGAAPADLRRCDRWSGSHVVCMTMPTPWLRSRVGATAMHGAPGSKHSSCSR